MAVMNQKDKSRAAGEAKAYIDNTRK